MHLLASLPTVIGAAAIAPALLVLWLVVAADERPGPPVQVWTAFFLGAASISLLGLARAPFLPILAAPENPWVAQALHSVFGVAAAGGNGQDSCHRRGLGAAPSLRGSDGHRGLRRRGGSRLCRLRKPRLSRAACRDVAGAGGVAQRPDGAVPRRARHYRRRLSGDRALRHRARRAPASPRLGAHLQPHPDPVCAGRAACRVRFPAADAAAKPRHRPNRPGSSSGRQAC